MQYSDWITQLIERADIGHTARGLAPKRPTESVIGRLPRRLRKLWAAYCLQVEVIKALLLALDAAYDYTQPLTSADPLDCPTLRHERNKLELMHQVFWLAVHDEFQKSGPMGIRQHWNLVSLPSSSMR